MKIDFNDPRLKLEALALGIIMMAAGIIWFLIEYRKYDGYLPADAYVTTTYYSSGSRHRSSKSIAYVTYTVDGVERKSSVELHCGRSALEDYKHKNIQIYYDPQNPNRAVSKKDKMEFPALQVIIAVSGLGFTVFGLVLRRGRDNY